MAQKNKTYAGANTQKKVPNASKADIENYCTVESMRYSFIFVSIALLIYCIVTVVSTGELPVSVFLILCGSQIVFYVCRYFFRQRMKKFL